MVQIPELCAEKTEAYKAGYKTICEIGKERIRRAGEKIKSENPLTTRDLDVGFRVLKVDDSNMKNVYYHPDDLSQQNLLDSVENIKEDRSDLDLLFGRLLDWAWSCRARIRRRRSVRTRFTTTTTGSSSRVLTKTSPRSSCA